MTKTELVSALAEKVGITKKDSNEVVDALLGLVTDELIKGGEISVTGFGVLKVKERAERNGRNPQTGETIKIAASKSIAFKAGKNLKELVNGK